GLGFALAKIDPELKQCKHQCKVQRQYDEQQKEQCVKECEKYYKEKKGREREHEHRD
uniref:Vicilin-like protein n=1 Tax=Anacardium occidentale TaxID=171929 RepID=UPI00240E9AE3|nr:Chain A, Vicilin-like protein [Anacardium occidentale]